jgi:hypothetical protein
MIFGFTTADDCEARRMSIRFYFYGANKKDALARYKEMYDREWITDGFHSIIEIPKKESKKIISKFIKAYKKAFNHIDIYSQYLEFLQQDLSIENLKVEKSILKYQKKNLKYFEELHIEALKLNVPQYTI